LKTTGLSRVAKELIIRQFEEEIKNRDAFFIASHAAVSALSMDKLRSKLRLSQAKYVAIKTSLGKRAFQKAGLSLIVEKLSKTTGIAFSGKDTVASTKVLVEFAKENEAFKIQAGYVNGQIIGPDRIKVLASLPSREVLLAKVAGSIQAPLLRLVNVLSSPMRQFVLVLDALAKKKGGASS
jgi:large subunit ribosomal protein L10